MDISSSASSLAASHFAKPASQPQAPKPAAAEETGVKETEPAQASAPAAPGTGANLDISV